MPAIIKHPTKDLWVVRAFISGVMQSLEFDSYEKAQTKANELTIEQIMATQGTRRQTSGNNGG